MISSGKRIKSAARLPWELWNTMKSWTAAAIPKASAHISYVGQLLGIIDCYEALTNEDRPYRRARQPLETLVFLKEDVEASKYNRKIFEKFCYSLI